MDLTEVRTAAAAALDKTQTAQKLIVDYVDEALKAAFEAMQSIEQVGPIATVGSGHPYDYTEARQRLAAVADFMFVTLSALETAAEYAHTTSNHITDARSLLSPAKAEGFRRLNEADHHLEEADRILSDLFEVDGPILPITATTTAFRLGQAATELTELIAMLS